MTDRDIARVAYEVISAFKRATGTEAPNTWECASQDVRDNLVAGVEGFRKSPHGWSPIQCHDAWVSNKQANGWKFGKLNVAKKTHPDMVPYYDLQDSEKVKNYLFAAVVGTLAHESTVREVCLNVLTNAIDEARQDGEVATANAFRFVRDYLGTCEESK